jgi:hypothetical protein
VNSLDEVNAEAHTTSYDTYTSEASKLLAWHLCQDVEQLGGVTVGDRVGIEFVRRQKGLVNPVRDQTKKPSLNGRRETPARKARPRCPR